MGLAEGESILETYLCETSANFTILDRALQRARIARGLVIRLGTVGVLLLQLIREPLGQIKGPWLLGIKGFLTVTTAGSSYNCWIGVTDKDAKICLLLYKNKILVVMKPTKKTQKIFEAKDKKLFQKNWVLERIVSMGVTQLVTRTNLSVECFNYTDGYFAKECRGPRNQDSRNKNQDSSRRTVKCGETFPKP
ncbi:hypothetical protein Tco_1276442 [Tanacetum coccineum]